MKLDRGPQLARGPDFGHACITLFFSKLIPCSSDAFGFVFLWNTSTKTVILSCLLNRALGSTLLNRDKIEFTKGTFMSYFPLL